MMHLLLKITTMLLLNGLNFAQEENPITKCPALRYANGCSVPGHLPAPYKHTFEPACNRHDMCYSCGQQYGWTRHSCDKGFYQDMRTLCVDTTLPAICRLDAAVYYLAVELLGGSHYSKVSPKLCHDKCVIPYSTPTAVSLAALEGLNLSLQDWNLTRDHVSKLTLNYHRVANETQTPCEIASQVVKDILQAKGINA